MEGKLVVSMTPRTAKCAFSKRRPMSPPGVSVTAPMVFVTILVRHL